MVHTNHIPVILFTSCFLRPEQMRSLQSISFQLKRIAKWFECSFNDCFSKRPWNQWALWGERRHCCRADFATCFLNWTQAHKKVHLFHEVLLPWCLDASLWFKCQIFIQLYKDVSVKNELFRVKHVTLEQQLCTLALSLSFILWWIKHFHIILALTCNFVMITCNFVSPPA